MLLYLWQLLFVRLFNSKCLPFDSKVEPLRSDQTSPSTCLTFKGTVLSLSVLNVKLMVDHSVSPQPDFLYSTCHSLVFKKWFYVSV